MNKKVMSFGLIMLVTFGYAMPYLQAAETYSQISSEVNDESEEQMSEVNDESEEQMNEVSESDTTSEASEKSQEDISSVKPETNMGLTLSYDSDAAIDEGHAALTPDEVIDLFNMEASDTDDGYDLSMNINISQSTLDEIDYSKAGKYVIPFTAADDYMSDYVSDNLFLTINDLMPTITTETDVAKYPAGEADHDLVELFGIVAVDGDGTDLMEDDPEATTYEPFEIDDSLVDYDTPGEYPVTIKAQDNERNRITKDVELDIIEPNTAPVINADSRASMDETATPLTDQEILDMFYVTAEDAEDGDLTSSITVDQSNVDYGLAGSYTIELTVTDSVGTTTNENITLNIRDIEPLLSVTSETASFEAGTTDVDLIAEFGATATELSEGDLTDSITISGDIDYTTSGEYPVSLVVVDNEGNEESVDVTVIITEPNTPPTITADSRLTISETNTALSDSELIDQFYVNATDSQDGDLTSSITVDQSSVSYDLAGDYDIIFTVMDSEGLESSITSTLTINDLLPTISLTNGSVIVEKGSEELNLIEAFEPVATEITDGDLTSAVVVDSDVDYNTVGSYEVVFTVSDNEDNEASITGTLVVEESEIPTITVDSQATISECAELTDEDLISLFNVEALDTKGNDITDSVTIARGELDTTLAGKYDLVFEVSDETGTSVSATTELTITDVLPTISLTNESITVAEGSEELNLVSAFKPVATEITDGDLTSAITTSEEIDYNTAGSYEVTFTVSDNEGNEVSATGTVIVEENPVVTITADSEASIVECETLTDEELLSLFNVEALDAEGNNIISDVTIARNKLDTKLAGSYDLVFEVTSGGITTSASSTLLITDLLPSISLGYDTVTVDAGNDALDLIEVFEPVATEIAEGDLTSSVVVNSDIDYNAPGSYEVTFTAKDNEGNEATAVGTIIVKAINQLPTVSANESKQIDEEKTMSDEELVSLFEVTADDTEDGDISEAIKVDQTMVEYSTPGNYQVVFTATDSQGGTSSFTSDLEIKDVLPTITLGQDSVTVDEGSAPLDLLEVFNPVATEITEGDLTDSITVSEKIDYNVAGSYAVDFTVSDEEGNKAEASGTVIIRHVNQAPVIKASNTASMQEVTSVSHDQLIELFDVSVMDKEDGDLTDNVVIDQSEVDTTTAGEYDVVFNVVDSEGESVSATSSLNITDALPTIELTNKSVTVTEGSEAIDIATAFGPVATEIEEGDLNSQVIESDNIDYSVPGTYQVVFTVSDDEGNKTEVTGSLVVQAKESLPVITGDNQANIGQVEEISDEQLINLFNISAIDSEGNDLTNQIDVDQSDLDTKSPGNYDIVFSLESSAMKSMKTNSQSSTLVTTLTITDTIPTLNVESSEVEVEVGTKNVDYIELFGAVATEISDGDLTKRIEVDSSNVNLDTVGKYQVTFTITDSDGNKVIKNVVLSVIDNELEGDEADVSNSVDDNSEANSTGKSSETKVENNGIKLSNTGSLSITIGLGLLLILVALLTMRTVLKNDTNK